VNHAGGAVHAHLRVLALPMSMDWWWLVARRRGIIGECVTDVVAVEKGLHVPATSLKH
jgi:hypothetical protein